MTNNETCATCRYFFDGVECRRYPPTPAGERPSVAEWEWCGEWVRYEGPPDEWMPLPEVG